MSRMRKEIAECLSNFESADGKMTAVFSFPPAFAGFQGHFENNPVLPGICKIQAVLAMHDKAYRGEFRLKEVTQAKYFAPVGPGQPVMVHCESKPSENKAFLVKALIQKENTKVAMLQMVIENVQS